MFEIIKWLRTVEQAAHRLYGDAALLFEQDKPFATFLRRLAEDETSHFHMLGSAAQYLRENEMTLPPEIEVDPATREQIKASLVQAWRLVREGEMTKKQMVELVVDAETSELNELFLYVLDTLRQYDSLFEHGAAAIQSHQDRVCSFVATLPEALRPAQDVEALPTIWKRRYLVVDDNRPVRDLLQRYLSRMGTIEVVASSQEGLDRLADHYFDVVITDVEMPEMDGVEFYRRATARDPEVGQRFLFCSGFLSQDQEDFFREHGMACIAKPFQLARMGQMVQEVVERTSAPRDLGAVTSEASDD